MDYKVILRQGAIDDLAEIVPWTPLLMRSAAVTLEQQLKVGAQ